MLFAGRISIPALDVFVVSKRHGIMKTQKSTLMHLWFAVLLACYLVTPVEFCLAQTNLSETYSVKLDEYGDLNTDDEAAHLDLFAEKLFKQPNLRGYIVTYDEPRMWLRGSYLRRIYGVGRYLTESRGIEANRVIVVDGGYKEKFTTELWLVPAGANPPTPAPSMSQPTVNTSVAYKFDVECLDCDAAVNLYREGLDVEGLKFYAEALRKNLDSRALIIVRPDRNISVRRALKEARQAKGLLVNNHGIDANRIIIKSGRGRNDGTAVAEMWIVPHGAKQPTATSNNSLTGLANRRPFIL